MSWLFTVYRLIVFLMTIKQKCSTSSRRDVDKMMGRTQRYQSCTSSETLSWLICWKQLRLFQKLQTDVVTRRCWIPLSCFQLGRKQMLQQQSMSVSLKMIKKKLFLKRLKSLNWPVQLNNWNNSLLWASHWCFLWQCGDEDEAIKTTVWPFLQVLWRKLIMLQPSNPIEHKNKYLMTGKKVGFIMTPEKNQWINELAKEKNRRFDTLKKQWNKQNFVKNIERLSSFGSSPHRRDQNCGWKKVTM